MPDKAENSILRGNALTGALLELSEEMALELEKVCTDPHGAAFHHDQVEMIRELKSMTNGE